MECSLNQCSAGWDLATEVMSYADKKAKREQEIAGLKEALTILSADAFLQVSLQYMFDR